MTARGSYAGAAKIVCFGPGCDVALEHEVVFMGRRYVFPDDPRKRYCSSSCKQRAYRQRIDWYESAQGLPAGLTIRERNKARRNRSSREWDVYCTVCEKRIITGRADRRYCSPTCKQVAYRDRTAAAS